MIDQDIVGLDLLCYPINTATVVISYDDFINTLKTVVMNTLCTNLIPSTKALTKNMDFVKY